MSRREHYMLNTKYYGMRTPTQAPPVAQDDFPHFTDGDVLIIITPSRRYKLHSDILRRSSPTFTALLDQDAAVDLSRNAKKKGVTTRYRLHMVQNANGGVRQAGVETPSHVLRRIPLDEGGGTVGDYPVLLGDANENGRVVPQWVLVSVEIPSDVINQLTLTRPGSRSSGHSTTAASILVKVSATASPTS